MALMIRTPAEVEERLQVLYQDLFTSLPDRRNHRYARQASMRIQVLEQKLDPDQAEYLCRELVEHVRYAAIAEAMWLWSIRSHAIVNNL